MAWIRNGENGELNEIERTLLSAMGLAHEKDEDLETFRKTILENPEYLYGSKDEAYFLRYAAGRGKLSIVKCLVEELGHDINRPMFSEPNMPEGAIRNAIDWGHIEVVRWMLEHGAQLNYEVEGRARCFALTDAACCGHFEIVKLLVEHGANVNASWGGLDPYGIAKTDEIRDYLYSKGARVRIYSSQIDNSERFRIFAAGHKHLRQCVADFYGEIRPETLAEVRHTIAPVDEDAKVLEEVVVTLHLTEPNEVWNARTLFTIGLSDHILPTNLAESIATELMLLLPTDWPVSTSALKKPENNWPVRAVQQLVRELLEQKKWPGTDDYAFFENDELKAASAEVMADSSVEPLSHWFAFYATPDREGEIGQQFLPDERWINFFRLFPVYAAEKTLAETKGVDELFKRFAQEEISFEFDLNRKNVGL